MLIGLTGKPSVGKSTFFKAATLAEIEINSRPFTTIKSSEGVAYVKIKCVDTEFGVQCNPKEGFCIKGNRFLPIKLMDVPGLIHGSHQGKGMGNRFLDDLRQADAFIHVIDISGSTNEKGEFVKPLTYDPIKDIEMIENEIDMWYYQILKKGWEKFARTVKQENLDIKKALAKQLSGLKVTEDDVQEIIKELKLLHHPVEWSEDDLKELASRLRKKTKPMIIIANKIDVEGALYNLDRVQKKFKDYKIVPCSAESELALREAAKHKLIEYAPGDSDFNIIGKLNDKQKNGLDFVKENILKKFKTTGVQDVLNYAVFDLLNYIAVFPGGVNKLMDSEGNIIPDCFLMPAGTTALEFAYRLHTDIGDNFIKAVDVKTKKPVGKEHILKNRDVIEIMVKK